MPAQCYHHTDNPNPFHEEQSCQDIKIAACRGRNSMGGNIRAFVVRPVLAHSRTRFHRMRPMFATPTRPLTHRAMIFLIGQLARSAPVMYQSYGRQREGSYPLAPKVRWPTPSSFVMTILSGAHSDPRLSCRGNIENFILISILIPNPMAYKSSRCRFGTG